MPGEHLRIEQLATTNVHTAENAEKPTPVPTVVLRDGAVRKVVLGDDEYLAIVVPPKTRVADVAANSGLLRMMLRRPPVVAGIVVFDGTRVTGFVPRDRLVEGLVVGAVPRDVAASGSDPLLHGDPVAVLGAVRIRCRTCGVVGGYDFYLPGDVVECVGTPAHPLDADL